MSISRVLSEKLMDEVEDDQKPAGGGPGPGETQDAYDERVAAEAAAAADDKADKGDDIKDDAKDDKKAAKADPTDDPTDTVDDKKGDKDSKITIPKFRYDAAANRAKKAEEKVAAAEARIQELLGQGPASDPTAPAKEPDTLTIDQAQQRIEDLDAEVETALEADDTKKMMELMREQRDLRDGIYEAKLEVATRSGTAAAVNDVQLDRVITEIEEQVPVLNPNAEEYDDALAVEVLELADALELKGNTPAEAMISAIDYMSGKLGIDAVKAVDTAKTQPKKTDVDRNAKTAQNAPPDVPGATGGADSDQAGHKAGKINVMDMSEKEFDALADKSPEELAQLRGDAV